MYSDLFSASSVQDLMAVLPSLPYAIWETFYVTVLSTLLSLVLVPVVYEFVDDFENWLRPKLAKLITPREAPGGTVPEDRL